MEYKFTKSAQNVLKYANEIATELGHSYIGTEHILYGLVKEENGVAKKILESQGLNYENVKEKIEELLGKDDVKLNTTLRIYSKN